jgi:adenine-specific DNA-methyltransferase
VELRCLPSGEWVVEMQGVDIYDPVDNTIQSARADKVAAWFLDSDYDGQTFCISQAFFPDSSAWEKLARALKRWCRPGALRGLLRDEVAALPGGKAQAAIAVGEGDRPAIGAMR